MPFFSKLKSAKKAADKHKQAANAQTDDKPAAAPYKHVPTHAARDALSGTPDGWSTRERSAAIAAAHKRRSELDLLRASTGGDYRFDMEHNRMAHMRAANDDLSRSGSMMNMANMAYADSSRLNFTPPLSSSSSHLSLNDKYHPRPSFGRQDTGLSSGSMGRRHEQLQRSSLNSTIKDAPPVPALPENYRQSHYGGHSVRPSASSAQTSSMSARSSYQTRPSPLSTKSESMSHHTLSNDVCSRLSGPSPVDSSNSSLNSMNSEGSTNSLGKLTGVAHATLILLTAG